MTKRKKTLRALAVLCLALSFPFLLLALAPVRAVIIRCAEDFLRRDLADEVWHGRLFARGVVWFLSGAACAAGFFLLSEIRLSDESGATRLRFLAPTRSVLAGGGQAFVCALAATFALISAVRLHWLGEKTGWHEDELYTIGITNVNDIGFWHTSDDFEKGVPYSGKEIKDAVFFDDGSLGDTLHDVARLWVNTGDNPNTDFYYILHRLAFFRTRTHDFGTIRLRLGILHYLIFAVSFHFMLLLLSELSESRASVILLLLASFLNPATVGLGVFFRAYIVEEMMLIVFTYVFVVFYKAVRNGETVDTRANLVKGAAATALTLNSSYFSALYVALLGLFLLALCLRRKRRREAFFFVTMLFSALIATRFLYLDFGMGFVSERYPSSFADSMRRGLLLVVTSVSEQYANFFALLAVFVLNVASGAACAAIARKKGGREEFFAPPAVIFLCALLWLVLTGYFCPIKSLRYCAPAFALLCSAAVPTLRGGTAASRALAAAIHAMLALSALSRSFPSQRNRANIEHLDDSNPAYSKAEYAARPEETVFIQLGSSYEKILPYLNDSQTYYFVDDESEIGALPKSGPYWYISEFPGSGIPDFRRIGGK